MSPYEIVQRVQSSGLYLGCWGTPEGAEATFTRREFVRKAQERGLITAEEASALRIAWAGCFDFALDD
jgi:hypothetical protein